MAADSVKIKFKLTSMLEEAVSKKRCILMTIQILAINRVDAVW